MNTVRKAFFLSLGILSLLYYFICIAYAHSGVSWLWIWPLLSLFCFARYYMLRKEFRIPKAISRIYYTAVLLFLSLFLFVEGRIIGTMYAESRPGLDYIVTMGAAVHGNIPSTPLQLRINATIDYLYDNPNTILIASGGKGRGETISEAKCISMLTEEAGIAPERILLEEASHNTNENILYSFANIPEGESVGLVTNSFHMYRAMRIANLQGHTVSPVPAPTLLPLGIHYTVREFFAVIELEVQALLQ